MENAWDEFASAFAILTSLEMQAESYLKEFDDVIGALRSRAMLISYIWNDQHESIGETSDPAAAELRKREELKAKAASFERKLNDERRALAGLRKWLYE